MRSPRTTVAGESRKLSTSLSRMSWAEWADAVEIEPSIYASDFSHLGVQLDALHTAGAKVFHFDVGDGHFIPEITIGPIVAASISPLVRGWGARLDCHLMVSEPEKHFEAIAKAGGDSVTFHVEASDEPARTIALARSLGLGVGVAFSPETAVEDAVAAAAGTDLVLCMAIHPGYSGQAFMPDAFDRITRLRALLPDEVRYTLGLRDQLLFPEIDYMKVDKARGMNVSVVTSARTDQEARKLLQFIGMPFRAN